MTSSGLYFMVGWNDEGIVKFYSSLSFKMKRSEMKGRHARWEFIHYTQRGENNSQIYFHFLACSCNTEEKKTCMVKSQSVVKHKWTELSIVFQQRFGLVFPRALFTAVERAFHRSIWHRIVPYQTVTITTNHHSTFHIEEWEFFMPTHTPLSTFIFDTKNTPASVKAIQHNFKL